MSETSITREEQYTLITVQVEVADSMLFEILYNQVITEMEEGRLNFIFDFSKLKDFNHALYLKLNHINNIILKENGILIIACFTAVNEDLFNDLDIVSTKTVVEASDYIFMEEIERHFLEVDDDEDDEA